ncbi:hypothetical protein, partial [Candidatus Accumulibacter vicinus]|uniref:hypothetical protein n=1 Tax=Candidatus Accumulibacter vicinus TaxID=2954382 RepID=UPI00235B6C73
LAAAREFLRGCERLRSVVYDESEKGVSVYPLAKSTKLRSNPQFSDKSQGATVSLAEPLVIQKTAHDWIHVTTADMSKTGWIHRGAVTYSERQARVIKESPHAPTNIIVITKVTSVESFTFANAAGVITWRLWLGADLSVIGGRKWVIEDGDCLSFDESASRFNGIIIKAADLTQTISRPTVWGLYCYSPTHKKLLPIADMIGAPGAPTNKVEAKPK